MTDDISNTIEIRYLPDKEKEQSLVRVSGDGSLDHFLDAFQSALIAAGFGPDTTKRLCFKEKHAS